MKSFFLKLRELIEDPDGKMSSGRIISYSLVASGIVYLFVTRDAVGAGVCFTAGAGTKVASRYAESKGLGK